MRSQTCHSSLKHQVSSSYTWWFTDTDINVIRSSKSIVSGSFAAETESVGGFLSAWYVMCYTGKVVLTDGSVSCSSCLMSDSLIADCWLVLFVHIIRDILSQSVGHWSMRVIFIHPNRGRNHWSDKQRRHRISGRTRKAHHSNYWWQARERLPVPTPVSGNPAIQRGCHTGHFRPHNPWGRLLAVPAFLLFLALSLAFGTFTTEGK